MPSRKNRNKKIHTVSRINGKKESQAALDYLVSWGWVLIIIVLALVILFSLGVFKVPAAPTIISGFQGITMQAAQANSTMMVVRITDNYNQFVNITGIAINVNGNTYTSYYCLNSIISAGQSTLCRVPVSIPTSSYLSKIQISFTPYKSSIYELSNGTVSSTLVSGAIPINNQLTYFIEKGMPYGSTFTVNYNTSVNSTVVSGIKDNVSFNLPFGSYYFSVPSVTYQGCISTPNPSAGYHSTGVEELVPFTSNCTTTFSETGLPSNQLWQVSYNGTVSSSSTGYIIQIKTNNTKNAQVYYTAIAKSDNLACVSYYTPSIRLGGSYTFNSWNCTTTFTETGLPTASGYNEWVTKYDGLSSSVSPTGSQISIYQTGITAVSQYTAASNSYELSCLSNPGALIFQGSAESFSWWVCTTNLQDNGLSPYPSSWNTQFSSTSQTGISVDSNSTYTQNITAVTPQSYSTNITDFTCSSSGSEYPGSDFIPPWQCTTTFPDTGVTNYPTSWNAVFDGVSENSQPVSSNIAIPTGTGYVVLGDHPFSTSINGYACSSSGSALAGSDAIVSVDIIATASSSSLPWQCTTTFSNSGVTNYPTSWNAVFDGVSENSQPVSSNIAVPTGTGPSYLGSFSYTTAINSYACSSSSSTLAGSAVSTVPWQCITTFDTNSVLSSDYPDGWSVKFDSIGGSGSTSNNIQITSEYGPSVLGSFSYSSSTGTYDCYSNNPPSELAGSTVSNIPWQCTTTFTQSGLQSTNEVWAVEFNGVQSVSSNPITFNTGLGYHNVFVPSDFLNGVSQKFTQSNSPTSLLAGSSGSVSYSTNGIVPPSGLIYYVPITISNNQGSATPNGFQQRVMINSQAYSYYEASNLQNVEFFYSDGQIIPSWLELGNSSYSGTVYWLKMNSLGAYSSETIYMGFATPSTNLFNGNTVGEAPQLSPSYAEYDNGGNVFNFYLNGVSNTAGFSTDFASVDITLTHSSVSYTPSESITAIYLNGSIGTPAGGSVMTVYNASSFSNAPLILETNFNTENALGSDNGVLGLSNNSNGNEEYYYGIGTQSGGNPGAEGVTGVSCSSTTCYFEYQDYAKGDYVYVVSFSCGIHQTCYTLDRGGTYSAGNNENGVVNSNWHYAELTYTDSSSYTSYVGGLPEYVNSGTGYSSTLNTGFTLSGPLYFASLSYTGVASYYAEKTFYNWIFGRDYPPNGAMPSVSFGSLEPAGIDVNSSGSGVYSEYFTWNGGGSDYNYYASSGASSESYYLYNYNGVTVLSGNSASSCPQLYSVNSLSTGIYDISITSNGGGYGSCGDTMAELT